MEVFWLGPTQCLRLQFVMPLHLEKSWRRIYYWNYNNLPVMNVWKSCENLTLKAYTCRIICGVNLAVHCRTLLKLSKQMHLSRPCLGAGWSATPHSPQRPSCPNRLLSQPGWLSAFREQSYWECSYYKVGNSEFLFSLFCWVWPYRSWKYESKQKTGQDIICSLWSLSGLPAICVLTT